MDTSIYYSNSTRTCVILERERSQLTDIKIRRDGAQIVPTSGKYTLKKPSGEKIIDAAAVSIDVSGTCSYTLLTSDLPASLELAEGYIEEWEITIVGNSPIFRRMAALCLRRLYPVVSQQDLINCYSQFAALLPANLTSYQTYIDVAWQKILRKLRTQGPFSYLITSPDSFFDSHLHLTLSLIWFDFHSNLGAATSRYFDLATTHQAQWLEEWAALSFIYDEGHDNKPNANSRTTGQPVIFLNSGGGYRYRWGR